MGYDFDELRKRNLQIENKEISVESDPVLVAPSRNVEDIENYAKTLETAKRSYNGTVYGQFEGVTLRVGPQSTEQSIIEDYKAQKSLQASKGMKNEDVKPFESASGNTHVSVGQREDEMKNEYYDRMTRESNRLHKDEKNEYSNVYGWTNKGQIITVSKGMTTEQIASEERFLNNTDNTKTVSSDLYLEDAKKAQLKNNLMLEFEKLDTNNMEDSLKWFTKVQGLMPEMDPEFKKFVVEKFEAAGFKERKNTGEKVDKSDSKAAADYIIGRVIKGIKYGDTINPEIQRVVDEWEKNKTTQSSLWGLRMAA